MSRVKWYSPQLSRELVSRLYHKARAEQIPITKLTNRIVEDWLGSHKSVEVPTLNEKKIDSGSK
jgi:hypothetical protein